MGRAHSSAASCWWDALARQVKTIRRRSRTHSRRYRGPRRCSWQKVVVHLAELRECDDVYGCLVIKVGMGR